MVCLGLEPEAAVVVVKWSAYSPSTPTIRVQNPLTPSVVSVKFVFEKNENNGREPWSSGNWKRLTSQRSWVRILAPYAGWTFFHIPICCKNCNV